MLNVTMLSSNFADTFEIVGAMSFVVGDIRKCRQYFRKSYSFFALPFYERFYGTESAFYKSIFSNFPCNDHFFVSIFLIKFQYFK